MDNQIHRCECHTHGFTVAADADDRVVYVTSWTYGDAGRRLSFSDKVRWCWKILTTGEPYNDQLTLSPATAESLGRALVGASAEADSGVARSDEDDSDER